jgi:integrase
LNDWRKPWIPRYRSLVYTDAYLGLRWSELAAVKRTSLDLDGRRLLVVAALQMVGHDWVYTDQLKTTRSRRSLALAPFLTELLREPLTGDDEPVVGVREP